MEASSVADLVDDERDAILVALEPDDDGHEGGGVAGCESLRPSADPLRVEFVELGERADGQTAGFERGQGPASVLLGRECPMWALARRQSRRVWDGGFFSSGCGLPDGHLSVATFCAKVACVTVANERQFEPECWSPAQTRLENAWYRPGEIAGRIG